VNTPLWVERRIVLAAHDEALAAHGGAAGVRDMGLLESAMARPQNLFAYGERDVATLAAAYAFGIVRNHPFVDGNKRTGFITAVFFLELNGHRFAATEVDATLSVLSLAAGEIDEATFAAWLRENVAACQ
jgi:death-on-curing protein